jgi:hypothetical protein
MFGAEGQDVTSRT